jgi:hypothetical protein
MVVEAAAEEIHSQVMQTFLGVLMELFMAQWVKI